MRLKALRKPWPPRREEPLTPELSRSKGREVRAPAGVLVRDSTGMVQTQIKNGLNCIFLSISISYKQSYIKKGSDQGATYKFPFSGKEEKARWQQFPLAKHFHSQGCTADPHSLLSYLEAHHTLSWPPGITIRHHISLPSFLSS